MRGWG